MAIQGVSRLRATAIAVGTVEAVTLVGLLASWVYAGAKFDIVRAVLFANELFIVQFGPSVICVIAGLALGIKNRWLWIALALLIVAPSLPYAVVALFGGVDL